MKWLESPWGRLVQRIEDQTLPHALLIQGPRGGGKTELANRLAQSVLCMGPGEHRLGCEQCRACTYFQAGTHPDFHRLEVETDSTVIKVDQVRQLIDRISLTSSLGSGQVFIVDPADLLNAAAANAFLKTLEEPTPGTLIILVADSPGRLPATVRSRCQALSVALPDATTALAWVRSEADVDETMAQRALDAAGGAPLLATRLLAEGGVERVGQTLDELQGLARGRGNPTDLAASWLSDESCNDRLDWWCQWLKDLLWAEAGNPGGKPPPLTLKADFASLVRYLEHLLEARRLMSTTVAKDLVLEELFIAWRELAARGG